MIGLFNQNVFLKELFKRESFFHSDIIYRSDELKDAIFNKSILVIGGAGSIGSSYIKEILHFRPAKLVVVDIHENGLTELTRELRSSNLLDQEIDYRTYPIDYRDSLFDKLFIHEKGFTIVANFAAHKHVRTERDIYSIEALLRNNVFGAIKLIELLTTYPPLYFFSTSTDKATNPINIMGASKKLMEKIILSSKVKFRVTTARFANVAFSNGSLLEGFINRINKLQPIACPSDIKRYFVTPEESGMICILATFFGQSGDIFYPKLIHSKDEFYFKNIALSLLNYLGYKPLLCKSEAEAKSIEILKENEFYPVYFYNSDTSGEKLYEEFYDENDNCNWDLFESLGVIRNGLDGIKTIEIVSKFELLFSKSNLQKEEIVELIKEFVPEFIYFEAGKNLDQRM